MTVKEVLNLLCTQYLFQESSASLEVQGSSKLKIQINEPRFKKGEVFFIAFRLL